MKNLIACIILTLNVILTFAQGGWYWQNPLPQGNSLHDIYFIDNTKGWAVGDHGTILYTEDQGSEWRTQNGNTTAVLYAAYFLSEDKGWIAGQHGTILYWDGSIWTAQESGFTGLLYDIFFVSSQTGWVVGQDETVLYTVNGGNTWTTLYTGGTEHYFSVFFLNENEGYLAGAAGSNGVIKSTENGGTSWNYEIIPANRMNSIFFADENSGWAVGDNGAIFHKPHVDSAWILQNCGSTNDLTAVCAINPHQVWASGKEGIIYHSNNDGDTWFPETSNLTDNLNSIFILNGESGWAAGNAGKLLYTFNGGGTWLTLSQTGPEGYLRDITFMYPEIGMVVGDNGLIYSSLDAGETWSKDTSGVSIDLHAIDFSEHRISTDGALAVGYGGAILRRDWESPDLLYEDWVSIDYDYNEDFYGIHMHGRSGWATGQFGSIAYTSDFGYSWELQHQDMGYHLYDIHFPSDNYGWAVGMSAKILHTVNKGQDWEEQTSPVNTNFNAVYFCDIYSGWAVGYGGAIIHTSNGGTTWVEQSSGTWEFLTDVYFTDCNNGWIVGDNGTILHTSNGGETWGKQEGGTSNLLWSVYFADPAHGWISGIDGSILYTLDGGGNTNYEKYPRYMLQKPIADYLWTIDTLYVTESPGEKAAGADKKVVAVEVILDTVLHTSVNDLEFILNHDSISDTLLFREGGENEDFIGTILSDVAIFPIDSGLSPYTDLYKPFSPLSAFAGQDPAGSWVLRIYDAVSGNTGSLNAWGLVLYVGEYEVAVSIDNQIITDEPEIKLFQNYPNPFNEQTYIKYYLPENEQVEISIYNFLGQKVQVLETSVKAAGTHQVSWNAVGCKNGIYIVQLRVGSRTFHQKVVLLQ